MQGALSALFFFLFFFRYLLYVGSVVLLQSLQFLPYPQLEERLCPRCAWKPKTARTLLKACTLFLMYAIESPSQQSCEIGPVFGTQPGNACLLGHCYLFLHQVSLQHVQGLFRLLLRIVPATWKIFVGSETWGWKKGRRRQLSAFILGRSKCCRLPSAIVFTGKTNPRTALSFSSWLLALVCSFLTFHLSSFAATRTEARPSSVPFFSCVQLACFLCNIYKCGTVTRAKWITPVALFIVWDVRLPCDLGCFECCLLFWSI